MSILANWDTLMFVIKNEETREYMPHSGSFGMPALYRSESRAKSIIVKKYNSNFDKYRVKAIKILEM